MLAEQMKTPGETATGGYTDPSEEAQGLLPWHTLNLTRPNVLFWIRFPLSISLLIVRALGVFIIAALLWVHCIMWTCCTKIPTKAGDPPISKCRQKMIQVVLNGFARLALFLCGFYWISVTRHKGSIPTFTIFASENERANIIVSNHVSPVGDILYFLYAHCPGFVSKASVLDVPLIGRVAMAIQSIFIERSAKSSRDATRDLLLDRAKGGMDFPPIIIFPEATTTNGVAVAKFKVGAFLAGEPVQPVAIRYPFMNFSPSWSTEGALYHLAMLWSQCWNCMEVIYLPIYFPNDQEKANPKLFSDNVQREIAHALGVPASNYGLEQFPKEAIELRQAEGKKQWELFKGERPPIPPHMQAEEEPEPTKAELSVPAVNGSETHSGIGNGGHVPTMQNAMDESSRAHPVVV